MFFCSCLCVVSSWGSFLINPKVCFHQNQQIFRKLSQKVIPGRVSMLVTLFLSLTALLVSTISSSPEVTAGIDRKARKKPSPRTYVLILLAYPIHPSAERWDLVFESQIPNCPLCRKMFFFSNTRVQVSLSQTPLKKWCLTQANTMPLSNGI